MPPSSTGSNGRDASGRFAPGNRLARGNPYARRVHEVRSAFIGRSKPEHLEKLYDRMLAQALDGDMVAARELLSRLLGKPTESDLLERLDRLEAVLGLPHEPGEVVRAG